LIHVDKALKCFGQIKLHFAGQWLLLSVCKINFVDPHDGALKVNQALCEFANQRQGQSWPAWTAHHMHWGRRLAKQLPKTIGLVFEAVQSGRLTHEALIQSFN
jgi:hypothetical protein